MNPRRSSYRGCVAERPMVIYEPGRRPAPAVIVLFPGGGFVRDAMDASFTLVAATMAERLGAAVVVPGYTLAPEAPFPAAAEDAYAALACAGAHAARVAVAGVEAGGNLAAVAAMMARDRAGPPVIAQVLVAPMLDPSLTAPSMRSATAETYAACYRAYLPDAADRTHPYAAPGCSTRLGGLAPALILTAMTDPLRDEAEEYGAKLIAAGVTTQVSRLARIEGGPGAWTPDAWNAIAAFLAPRITSRFSARTEP